MMKKYDVKGKVTKEVVGFVWENGDGKWCAREVNAPGTYTNFKNKRDAAHFLAHGR